MDQDAAPSPRTAIALALYRWLGLGDGAGASKGVHVNVQKLAGVYFDAGETAEMVAADEARWKSDDWRGVAGQPPTPSQAQDWRVKCRNGTTGHARTNANGNHNSAIKAEDDRTETPLSPERQAQIVAMRAKLATMPGATVAAGGAP